MILKGGVNRSSESLAWFYKLKFPLPSHFKKQKPFTFSRSCVFFFFFVFSSLSLHSPPPWLNAERQKKPLTTPFLSFLLSGKRPSAPTITPTFASSEYLFRPPRPALNGPIVIIPRSYSHLIHFNPFMFKASPPFFYIFLLSLFSLWRKNQLEETVSAGSSNE